VRRWKEKTESKKEKEKGLREELVLIICLFLYFGEVLQTFN
jgi:hypothetical protein